MFVKNIFAFLVLALLVAACTHYAGGDAALRAKIAGTWTTADVILPDQSRVSDVMTTFMPGGSWLTQYKISGSFCYSGPQMTMGTWNVTNGSLVELQTNVDGVSYTAGKEGGSKILRLDTHEMILSNWYSPRRVFVRRQ